MSEGPVFAFPTETDTHYYRGMTLRDYFAAQALPMIMRITAHNYNDTGAGEDGWAKASYSVADAMLKAREK